MNRILIIEDEEIILKALTRLLQRYHYDVSTAGTIEAAIAAQPQSFDLILADLRLPGGEGTDIIPLAGPIPVVIMTSHASVRSAVTAMRSGAIDYIAKPFDHDELLLIIERSLKQNRLRAQNQSLKHDLARLVPAENIQQCQGMKPLVDSLCNLNEQQRFIALHGESGTGKELLARMIHARSKRSEAPFVVADLPTISPERIQFALFGGVIPEPEDKFLPGGLLNSAHNGTLILRHPGVLSAEIQQEMATVLTARSLLGAVGQRALNTRTILICDVELTTLLEQGQLHEPLAELFIEHEYRVPPLREFRDDIVVLAKQFLTHYERYHHRKHFRFGEEAMAALLAYSWPGNKDELKTMIERAVLVSSDKLIKASDLGLGTLCERDTGALHDLSLDEYFRYFVLRNQQSLSETELASRLGLSRKALWERRQKMHLLRQPSKEE